MQNQILLQRVFNDSHKGRAGHINIQHYAQLIEDARFAWLKARGLPTDLLQLQSERVRFSGELHPGDEAAAQLQFYAMPAHTGCAVLIRRTRDGRVVTHSNQVFTSLAPLDGLDTDGQEFDLRPVPVDTPSDRVFTSYVGTVPIPLLSDGETLNARGLWYVMTEALWAVQTELGAHREYLEANGISGGASMFELQHRTSIAAQEALRVTTTAIGHSESSLRYQHDIFKAGDQEAPAITARYVLTYFDRQSGSRIPIPAKIMDALW